MTERMFLNRQEKPEMMGKVSYPATNATDGGLKVLVGLMEKCSYLKVTVVDC